MLNLLSRFVDSNERAVRRLQPLVEEVNRLEPEFAALSDEEIEAYVGSGEPLHVAGAFTLDGLGGAYVTGIEGDPHTVVGIGLPLLRDIMGELGIAWHDLWVRPA